MFALTGFIAPIVTPFTDDAGAVSEIRLARLARHLLELGISGFACCTETGEFTTISAAERKQVLEIVLREAHGAPVIAHCTRLGTAQSLDLCQHAGRHGALAAIIMPPYFGTYADEEIEQHVRFIVQHAGLPVILVDPRHSVRSASRERLANMPNLVFAESPEDDFRTSLAVDPPGADSDEFVVKDAILSPLVQIDPIAVQTPGSDLRQLSRLISRYGRTRVAKAALELRGIEVGPPRAPVLCLPREAEEQLEGLLKTK